MKKTLCSLFVIIAICVLLLSACEKNGNTNEKGDCDMKYIDVVNSLVDLKALATAPQKGEGAYESSSYNKLSNYNATTVVYENWSQNWDEGNDAPRTDDGGYLIAETEGAGAIVRIWSAKPLDGHIKIFIDGNNEPTVDMPFKDIFGSGASPFDLQNLCYDAVGGKNCYVPITYNNGCRVVLYNDWGQFYQVNYISFPDGTAIESFKFPLSDENLSSLRAVDKVMGGDMSALSDTYTDTVKKTETVTVSSGENVEILNSASSGAIVGLKIKINGLDTEIGADGIAHDWKSLSDMCISMRWDKSNTDAVWSTLGGFFASQTGLNEYSSLPTGVLSDGTMYSNWYMPFENGAVITIVNDGNEDYSVTYTVTTVSLEKEATEKLLRFHAKWVRAADPQREGNDRWPDSEFLYLEGTGRFVGTSLHVYKEIGRGDGQYNGLPDNNGSAVTYSNWWWGEGDEKFFVDGEKFPSWFGTGSEDYFGYAWGNWMPFSKAYHAQPFTNGGMYGVGNRLNNRFHIIDNIPFQSSFEACLEKYHRDGYANWVFTSFFYLDKEAEDGYSSVSLTDRTAYYKHPYPAAATFYEGEMLPIIDTSGRIKAETQVMSKWGSWSGNEQFILKAGKSGDFVRLYINVPKSGNYNLSAVFTKAKDFGIAQHYIDGIAVGGAVDLYNPSVVRTSEATIGSIYLEEGLHILTVKVIGKNEASTGFFYGLDFLRLRVVN